MPVRPDPEGNEPAALFRLFDDFAGRSVLEGGIRKWAPHLALRRALLASSPSTPTTPRSPPVARMPAGFGHVQFLQEFARGFCSALYREVRHRRAGLVPLMHSPGGHGSCPGIAAPAVAARRRPAGPPPHRQTGGVPWLQGGPGRVLRHHRRDGRVYRIPAGSLGHGTGRGWASSAADPVRGTTSSSTAPRSKSLKTIRICSGMTGSSPTPSVRRLQPSSRRT